MFNIILSENDIEELLSDNKLSTQAINAYIRLDKNLTNQIFSIKVKRLDGSYIELSKENIKQNGNIVVKETHNGYLKE